MLAARLLTVVALVAPAAAAEPHHTEPHHSHHHHGAVHEERRIRPRLPSHHEVHAPVHHAVAVGPPPVVAAPKPPPPPVPPVGSVTGLPLPRFASLRSEEVNMRSGPGTRYPIQWVYKRRDLPVEIEREFDVWRLVETDDGTKGWVHQATLIGNRSFVVLPASAAASSDLATAQTIRASASDTAQPAAYLKPGVIGHVLACDAGSAWCRVEAHGVTGYLQRSAMWGLLPGEVVAPH